MGDLFCNVLCALLCVSGVLAAGCLCVVAGVALLALIDGVKEIENKRKEDKHDKG